MIGIKTGSPHDGGGGGGAGGGAFKSIDSYKEQEQDHKIKKSAEKLKTSSSNVGKNKNQLKVQCLKVIQ